MTELKLLRTRERLARFLWDIAAEETKTRKWDEIAEDHPMRDRYRQAASIMVAIMPFVIAGPRKDPRKDQ